MSINKYVTNIIDAVNKFEWSLKQVYVENNCIYAEVKNKRGEIEIEGLYAGSDDDTENVYQVCNKLKYVLNFNNMLNDDNILI
ncbi:MAG: hypothetical protein J6D47_01360 [Peptostreptococcaceae bacterium]|jgi:hypothetical protein|nr:hypothetical protein [Peptostreptococcaceae bacterium]DAX85694.1 MAG TPA: hypothetical protein [Caudoviricetes sp.]